MNPIRLDVIEKKKSTILSELKVLTEIHRRHDPNKPDAILEHALSSAMQNCIAAVIDIAQHIAAETLSSPPESYSEAILSLGSIGALDQAFAEEFARIAKLRNVLVHLYDNVDHNFLFSLVPKLIQDSKRFVKEIASFFG